MAINNIAGIIAAVPTLPGVYRFHDEKERLLYVGKAKNLKKRLASYFHHKKQSPRIQLMLAAAAAVDTIVTESEAEALLLENNLIKSLKPKYNILFRDDKSYPFLCFSRHPYPRLMSYRGTVDDKNDYYGPFPDSGAVRETIDILQRVFRLRNCPNAMFASRTRPCLLHSIGRCSAPCTNAISPEAYAADAAQAKYFLQGNIISSEKDMRRRMEQAAAEQKFEEAALLRDRLRALSVVRSRHFADNEAGDRYSEADYIGITHNGSAACVNIIIVRGGRRIGEKRLFPNNAAGSDEAQVAEALFSQYYRKRAPAALLIKPLPENWREFAGHLAQNIVAKPRALEQARLDNALKNAQLALASRISRQQAKSEQLSLLAQRLDLPAPPQRIDCFDISHSMGEETVAARIAFNDAQPLKKEYRLFRIKQAGKSDDFAAINEAVKRCYDVSGRVRAAVPDLLLIDGGAGQVAAAVAAFAALELPLPRLFGIAKGAARKPGQETIVAPSGQSFNLPPTDSALHLLQAVRDEAHRFALTAHRRRRDKKRGTSSLLDNIEGIGPAKRRLLINYFGGLPSLQAASAAELAKVQGIGPALAARIYRAIH